MIGCTILENIPDSICIASHATEYDALEMVAEGHIFLDPKELTLVHAESLQDISPLRAAITEEMVRKKFFSSSDSSEFKLYCRRAEFAPNPEFFIIVAGLVEPDPDASRVSDELRKYAEDTITMRRTKLAKIAAHEVLGMPLDDEYFSFLKFQTEDQLPPGLLTSAPVAKTLPGTSTGSSITDSLPATGNEEVLQAFLDRFNIDKGIFNQLIRSATKQEQNP